MQTLRVFQSRWLWHAFAFVCLCGVAVAVTDPRSAEDSAAQRSEAPVKVDPRELLNARATAARAATAERLVAGGERRAEVINDLYGGVPQRGAALGSPDAPVTLRFFADLECLQARELALLVIPRLTRRWVRTGALRIVYHANKVETLWPEIFRRQQVAALAAGEQNRLWQFLGFFYLYQGPEFTKYADGAFLEAMGKEVEGLEIGAWKRARRAPALEQTLADDQRLADRGGIEFTPAFLIGPTGEAGEPLTVFAYNDALAFEEAIEAELRAGVARG